MKTIAITLQKGGSCKTTTAVNLSAILHSKGKKVLLIDMDSQANATFASGINSKELDYSLYNVLTKDQQYKANIQDAIISTKHYDILPADRDIADLTLELTPEDSGALKALTAAVARKYDYCIIDCPPALNTITVNALVASDYIVIPIEPRPFSFSGLDDLKKTIDELKNNNKKLSVLGILLTKYNNRTILSRTMTDLIDNYCKNMNTKLFSATIRESIAVPESQIAQQPLIEYAPKNKATIDYKGFTTELIKRMEG